MSEKKQAVIIGAGIGGITTSIYLAKRGYDVSIYEKNLTCGGRCGQLIHEGHRFDLGATMLLMPGVYREVFGSLGLNFDELLEIKPLEDLYKLYFDDGAEIAFTTDREKMRRQLEAIEKGSFSKSEEYVSEGYNFYKIAGKKLIGRNFYNFPEFATPGNMAMLIKLKTYLTHQKYIQRFFKNPHLQMAYTFQNIYVGQSPFDAPAFFSMIPAIELVEGSYFPKGGIYSVVEKLTAEAIKSGVKFYFDSEVAAIHVNKNKAESITLTDGTTIEAGLIVANADLPYVYRELLPDKKRSERLEKKKYSCSAMVFHWGLDKQYPQLAHHNVFLSDGFRTGLRVIFRDKSVDPHPSFYVHAPVRTDPGAAPANHDTISVIVGIGHIDDTRNQDWNSYKMISREAVINRLKQAGLADIEDHIIHERCFTPRTWESAYHVSKGSVFGSLSHSLFQMGYFRPHNRHDIYKNLYFAGGSTHPGNGIPLVLLSAKLTAERIIKEEKIRK
jgi:phytoene desaturase